MSGPSCQPILPVLDDIGIFLTAGRVRDPSVALTEAQDAERLGIGRVWLAERYDLKEAGALLGGVAARTSRLGIGTATVATGSRHPLLTAALAATMQAMYGGRFTLGLGRSSNDFLRGRGSKLRRWPHSVTTSTSCVVCSREAPSPTTVRREPSNHYVWRTV